MLKKSKKIKTISPSIISKSMVVGGDIVGEGAIEIFGEVNGDVRCLSVIVGEQGSVRGDITAEKVEISGEVRGSIKAKAVSCTKTAKVIGDILHQRINIEDGAYVDGNCRKHVQEEPIEQVTHLIEHQPFAEEQVYEYSQQDIAEMQEQTEQQDEFSSGER